MNSQKEDCRTLFSPVTPDAIRSALVETDAPASHAPRIAQVLDEIQLNAVQDETIISDGIQTQAADSRYLHLDEYTGNDTTAHSDLLFITGAEVSAYLTEYLPEDTTEFEREIVELTFRVYANKSGFDNLFQPPVVPLVVRDSSHDDLVMDEPGTYQPLPNGTREVPR